MTDTELEPIPDNAAMFVLYISHDEVFLAGGPMLDPDLFQVLATYEPDESDRGYVVLEDLATLTDLADLDLLQYGWQRWEDWHITLPPVGGCIMFRAVGIPA